MGWLTNPGQAAKDKAKQVVNNATHATCYKCQYTDLKTYFKKFNSKDWICKNARKCEKRRKKNGEETAFTHRNFGRQARFENGHWVD